MSAEVIDFHLANIVNNDITKNVFSKKAKVASVRPIFKKNEREKIENYRSVSILNCFSKNFEKFLLEKFKPFINSFLSEYIAAYRENYRTNHVLIRLIENWKKARDEKLLAGTVLMDLSKAFECIPHDLIIAKLHAYAFSQKTVTFIYSYLKRRKQKAKVNKFLSDFLTLLSGVPQGSILGPILFNIFFNDLLSTLKLSHLFNITFDNTILTTADNIDYMLLALKHELELAVKWFTENQMIGNPDKFQAIILQNSRNSKNYEPVKLEIGSAKIETKNTVKSFGKTIDNKLNFEEHISELSKKASMQLNAISCLQRFMGKELL